MKRLIYVLPILLLVVLIGCKDDDTYPYASFPSSTIEVDSYTTEYELYISSAYVTWTLTLADTASWISFSGYPTRDSSSTMYLDLQENLDTLDRVANFKLVYVNDSTITKEMEFTQLAQGKVITVEADTLYFSSSAQTAETTISSNVAWSATSSESWLTLSGGTSTKYITDDPLSLTFTANNDYNFRAATVTLIQQGVEDFTNSFVAYQRGIGDRSTDSLMLADMYSSMGGVDWTNSWNLSQPMTSWHGVTLDLRDGEQRVVMLDLSNNNLSGSIDVAVTNLGYLESLSLYNNNLEGEIPSDLGNIHFLKLLYLQDNNLTGSFPEAIIECSYLSTIHIGGNQLSGTLPESLGDLANLKVFGAANNNFTGTLPTTLGSSSVLEVIYVQGNRLSGEIPSTYMVNALWRTWDYPTYICPQQTGYGFSNCE